MIASGRGLLMTEIADMGWDLYNCSTLLLCLADIPSLVQIDTILLYTIHAYLYISYLSGFILDQCC